MLCKLAVIDAREHLLPNRVLYPAFAAAAILLTVAAVLEPATATSTSALASTAASAPGRLLGCAFGFILGWSLMHLVWRFSNEGIGYGDVRLAGYIGLHLGYFQPTLVLVALTLGFAIAAIAGTVFAIIHRSLRVRFALGPYLIAAAFAAVAFGPGTFGTATFGTATFATGIS